MTGLSTKLPWIPVANLRPDVKRALVFFPDEEGGMRWEVCDRKPDGGWWVEASQGGYTVAADAVSHFIAMDESAVPSDV